MYYNPFQYLSRAMQKAAAAANAQVKHQQTCPACGKTLVNIYRQANGSYLCRVCAEKEQSK